MNRVAKLNEDERINLTIKYTELIDRIKLNEYKMAYEITKELNINSRQWRKIVEDVMHLYMYGYVDKMILGTNKGYIYTGNKNLIWEVLNMKEHQFKSLAYNCYNLRKAIKNSANMTMEEYLKSIE